MKAGWLSRSHGIDLFVVELQGEARLASEALAK